MEGLVLRDVCFTYPKAKKPVLANINTSFLPGTVSSIRGYSGAGKSTLLYLIAGMEKPTSGTLLWNGDPIGGGDLTAYRRHTVSLIAQSYLLFPNRTALENICYPLLLDGKTPKQAQEEAREHMAAVHLPEDLCHRLPGRLSGGEQQRVAIARCLACHTPLIAADEPTGNLDEENALEVTGILTRLAEEEKKAVILVTHDHMIADLAQHRYKLLHGVLERM